jgi:hypothetical protein
MMSNSVQSLPVESLPFKYISGLNLSVASTSIIAVAPGQARDSNDNVDMPVSTTLFLNSAINGVNALDQGTIAASSNYSIYLISDSRNKKPVAALLSLSSNAFPLMPLGYDSYRLLGFAATNSSTQFTAATVYNTQYLRSYFLQPPTSVLSGGNATTYTAINLSSAVPDDPNAIVFLNVTFTPAGVGDTVQFAGTGNTASTSPVTITGVAAGVPQVATVPVVAGVSGGASEISYRVSNASDSVSVTVGGYSVTLS